MYLHLHIFLNHFSGNLKIIADADGTFPLNLMEDDDSQERISEVSNASIVVIQESVTDSTHEDEEAIKATDVLEATSSNGVIDQSKKKKTYVSNLNLYN